MMSFSIMQPVEDFRNAVVYVRITVNTHLQSSVEPRLKRIVVVDDEDVIASTCASILRLHGFHCREFNCPEEALSSINRSYPDLLLSDFMMPRMSGVDLALRVRQINPDCKFLFLSGVANVLQRKIDERVIPLACRVLQKPIHPLELVANVGQLFNEALL